MKMLSHLATYYCKFFCLFCFLLSWANQMKFCRLYSPNLFLMTLLFQSLSYLHITYNTDCTFRKLVGKIMMFPKVLTHTLEHEVFAVRSMYLRGPCIVNAMLCYVICMYSMVYSDCIYGWAKQVISGPI